MPEAKADKAACPGQCHGSFTVTADGVMRKHKRSIWHGGSNYETIPCEGSGKPPKGATPAQVKAVQAAPANVASSAMEAQRRAYNKLGLKWPPGGAKRGAVSS